MTNQYNRIFIVDDDEDMREYLVERLLCMGFNVEYADSAKKTLEKIKDCTVDLFLIDIKMPEMSGLELLEKLEIKENLYEAIIITAFTNLDDAKEAMQNGAFGYISKPVVYEELAALMNKALEMVKLKNLKRDYIRDLEQLVEVRTDALEQKNTALREMINQIDIEKTSLKNHVKTNINELVLPILAKLKTKKTYSRHIDLLQSHLKEITSSFGSEISDKIISLTPKEIEICSMLKGGLASKEIAALLNVSIQTVVKHRKNIRRKLKISNKKINLTSYLHSF